MAKKDKQPEPESVPAADETPPLRLEWIDPAELAANPKNWRVHPENQVAVVTDAIAECGWAGAALYNEQTGRLIDGHLRQKVGLAQGAKKIPVLVGSWTEQQEAKILATLDPSAGLAECDQQKLDELLREIDTGSPALQEMLAKLAEENGVVEPAEGDWPAHGETTDHSFLVHYTDEEVDHLKVFLGVDQLPSNKLGAMVLERIKAVAQT